MASNIRVKETIEDKYSWFNIKRFSISGLDFNFPFKTLDTKTITKDTFEKMAMGNDFQIFEVSKTVRSFDKILGITNENNDNKITSFFSQKKWLDSARGVINFTFNFNPFDHIRDLDNLSGFFDLYYMHSKLLVTVPNLRILQYASEMQSKGGPTIKEYLHFVDAVFNILDTKNNKPIFVPVSLRTSLDDIELICKHHLKNDHFNFWIDFEGKAINTLQLGRLRHLYRTLKEQGQFDNVVCYFTNIKREIISNSKIDNSPASDVLAAISGANIIGVNREPQRPFGDSMAYDMIKSKVRILDKNTYYYKKTDETTHARKDVNVTYNAVKLNEEFLSQSENFLKKMTITNNLKDKKMLKDNQKILKMLTEKHTQNRRVDDWF